MKKQDIIELLEEKKNLLETTEKLGKEEHNCIFSIALLKYEGMISILEEILEKFYSKKIIRKEPIRKRLEKSTTWLNLRLLKAIEQRDNCKSTDINVHYKKNDKVKEIKNMMSELLKKIKEEKK